MKTFQRRVDQLFLNVIQTTPDSCYHIIPLSAVDAYEGAMILVAHHRVDNPLEFLCRATASSGSNGMMKLTSQTRSPSKRQQQKKTEKHKHHKVNIKKQKGTSQEPSVENIKHSPLYHDPFHARARPLRHAHAHAQPWAPHTLMPHPSSSSFAAASHTLLSLQKQKQYCREEHTSLDVEDSREH